MISKILLKKKTQNTELWARPPFLFTAHLIFLKANIKPYRLEIRSPLKLVYLAANKKNLKSKHRNTSDASTNAAFMCSYQIKLNT